MVGHSIAAAGCLSLLLTGRSYKRVQGKCSFDTRRIEIVGAKNQEVAQIIAHGLDGPDRNYGGGIDSSRRNYAH